MLSAKDLNRIRSTIRGFCRLSRVKLAQAELNSMHKHYLISDGDRWRFSWMPTDKTREFHAKLSPTWFDLVWEPVDPIPALELLAKAGNE